jgi:hypothetical protein
MRKALLGVAVASVLLLTGAATGSAQVNCGIIQKDLDRGVTPKDIAELKGISLDDVKKCQEAKKNAPPAAAVEKPAAAPAGAMGGGDKH